MSYFEKLFSNLNYVSYLLYPKKCMFCDEVIPYEHEDFTCVRCSTELNIIFDNNTHKIFVLEYDELVRNAILNMKYKNKKHYAIGFAKLMYEVFSVSNNSKFDLVINVPMYWKKKLRRGYDQAEEIAIEFAKLTNIPFEANNLIRNKETIAQSNVSFEERSSNVIGVFEVLNPDNIAGKNIILIDDVYTSGSTIKECSMMLKEAGAGSICLLLLAKA